MRLAGIVGAAGAMRVAGGLDLEGAPGQPRIDGKAPSPAYVSDFLATSDGLALVRSFTRIKSAKLRRTIVNMVEDIAGD